jgi:hypothetical protein
MRCAQDSLLGNMISAFLEVNKARKLEKKPMILIVIIYCMSVYCVDNTVTSVKITFNS